MKKKIYLIRANKTKFGGAENYLDRLSNSLSRNNIDHEIINSIFPKLIPSWLRPLLFNLQVLFIKKDKFYFSLDRISCADLYRAGDGIHRVFLKKVKKSFFNPLHPVYIYLEKKCITNSKKIIVNSLMIKNQILENYGIDPNKIELIYSGINLKKIDRIGSLNNVLNEFPNIKSNYIITFVGSGFKRKGVSEFLKIISKLKTENVKAFIIGKEKKIRFYQNLATSLNIREKVIFTGPRHDVDNFYSISDIFLFPTHYEPFGNVILEAMNFENVIFTTKNNGASEILDDFFIMNSQNDYSVVNKIDDLLQDEKKLMQVKKNNRIISKEFSIEKNLLATLEVINEIID